MDNTNNNSTYPAQTPPPPSPATPNPNPPVTPNINPSANTWSNLTTSNPFPNPDPQPAAPLPSAPLPSAPIPTWPPPASEATPVIPEAPAVPPPWSNPAEPSAAPVQQEPAQPTLGTTYDYAQPSPQQPFGIPAPFSQPAQSIPSPLDNPYGAPVQPPPFDGGLSNQQNPIPAPVQPDITQSIPQAPEPQVPQQAPAWSPPQMPAEQPPAQPGTEQAPTDLSHLMGNSEPPQAPVAQPETVVVPQVNAPEVPTIPAEGKAGIPKWIIGLGVGLLIIVVGASAYFILGIGQTPKNTSLPAVEPSKTTQETTPAPVETPQPQQAAATDSANFGELQGSGTAPQASASAAPNSLELLRRQQQQGR